MKNKSENKTRVWRWTGKLWTRFEKYFCISETQEVLRTPKTLEIFPQTHYIRKLPTAKQVQMNTRQGLGLECEMCSIGSRIWTLGSGMVWFGKTVEPSSLSRWSRSVGSEISSTASLQACLPCLHSVFHTMMYCTPWTMRLDNYFYL